MGNRWGVLAVLFFIRTTMAVQFQSVGAVAPLLSADLGFSLADIGILVGIYSVPGVALALPAEGATTLRAMAQALNRRGFKSPRGGTWHPSSVANLLSRSESFL